MIDINQMPIPKFKIGDICWGIDYDRVVSLTISTVFIKGNWFDNGYVNKHDFKVEYELTTQLFSVREDTLFKYKEDAEKEMNIRLEDGKKDRVISLKEDFKSLKKRALKLEMTLTQLEDEIV